MKSLKYIINVVTEAAKFGQQCASFDVKWDQTAGTDINCIKKDGLQLEVQVPESGGCFEGVIICYDKDGCETCYIPVTVCPCENDTQCGPCSSCNEYKKVCESDCEDGQVCDGGCVNCSDIQPCPNGQICVGGDCKCPPGKVKVGDKCVDDCIINECPDGYRCTEDGCVLIECEEGVYNAEKDECVECNKTSDCQDPTKRCVDNGCDCIDGYMVNPEDPEGPCIPEPPCEFDTDCGDPCKVCGEDGCEPLNCPPDHSCFNGTCYPHCDPNDPIPQGYGVIVVEGQSLCIPCSDLDCNNECGLAAGCECTDGENCEGDDCPDLHSVLAAIQYEAGTPGVYEGDNENLVGVVNSITAAGTLFSADSQYFSTVRNHSFSLTVNDPSNSMTGGNWYYSPQSGVKGLLPSSTGSGSSTVNFSLSDLNFNSAYFYIIFEANDGRYVRFKTYFTQPTTVDNYPMAQGLQMSNVWESVPEIGEGAQGNYVGGTAPVTKICFTPMVDVAVSNTGAFIINPDSGNTLDVNFIQIDSEGCLIYETSGCGVWNGTIDIECKGTIVTIDLPEIFIDESACCEGADCGGGGGCADDDATPVDISNHILAYPFYGADNEHSIQLEISENNPNSPVSFEDLWNLGVDITDCWQVDDQSVSGGIYNDIYDDQSGIYTEAELDFSVGNVKIRFGQECSGILGSCEAVSGCRTYDICNHATMIIIDKNTGNLATEQSYSGSGTMDFIAIFSLPNTPNLVYTWGALPNGVEWVGGVPSTTMLNGVAVSEGTISWNNPDAGTLPVSVDLEGCQSSALIIFEAPDCTDFSAQVLGEADGDCGSKILTVTGQGGDAPYLYSLNDGPFSTAGAFTITQSGIQSILVKDSKGCEATVMYPITIADIPQASLVAPSEVCFDSSGTSYDVQLTNPSNVMVEVTITGGTFGDSTTIKTFNTSQLIPISVNGNASETIVSISKITVNECDYSSSESAETIILPNDNPQLTGPNGFCEGDAMQLTLSSGTHEVFQDGVSIGMQSGTFNLPTLSPGDYVFSIQATECSASSSITVKVLPKYSLTILNSNCVSGDQYVHTVNVQAVGTMVLSGSAPNGTTVSFPNNNQIVITSNSLSGSIQVTLASSDDYCGIIPTQTISWNCDCPQVAPPTITGGNNIVKSGNVYTDTYCQGESFIPFNVVANANGDQIIDETTGATALSDYTASSSSFTRSFKSVSSDGCDSEIITYQIQILNNPNLTDIQVEICPDDGNIYSLPSLNGVSYDWAPGQVNTPTISYNTTLGIYTVSNVVAAGSWVIVALDEDGCSDEFNFTAVDSDDCADCTFDANITVTETDVDICTGNTQIQANSNIAGATYYYSNSPNNFDPENPTFNGWSELNNQTFTPGQTIYIIATDPSQPDCYSNPVSWGNSNSAPSIDFDLVSDTDACELRVLNLSPNVGSWSITLRDSSLQVVGSATHPAGSTAPVVFDMEGLPAGQYTLNLTYQDEDGNACFIHNTPPIDWEGCCDDLIISGVVINETCSEDNSSDGSISLTVSGEPPYTYLWSNGATTKDLVGLTSGSYTVTVNYGSGCSEIREFIVGDESSCNCDQIDLGVDGTFDNCSQTIANSGNFCSNSAGGPCLNTCDNWTYPGSGFTPDVLGPSGNVVGSSIVIHFAKGLNHSSNYAGAFAGVDGGQNDGESFGTNISVIEGMCYEVCFNQVNAGVERTIPGSTSDPADAVGDGAWEVSINGVSQNSPNMVFQGFGNQQFSKESVTIVANMTGIAFLQFKAISPSGEEVYLGIDDISVIQKNNCSDDCD